jgi:aryl-alcohol dehydrogenase-like predicted oxidoreductase
MRRRALGSQGLEVSAIGLGCMGMSEHYGPTDEAQAISTLERAIELGVDLFDTSDVYGPATNEELLGRAFATRRASVVLATKFGILRDASGGFAGVDGRPEYVRASCEASLRRLGTDYIDLYYQHRLDPKVPIEETVGAMAELVAAGKVRYLGLSEVTADPLRRAHAEHPISALQIEYSLWARDGAEEVLPTARALGVGVVAYSPLGRGFLTGAVDDPARLGSDDLRHQLPRFRPENFDHNRSLARCVVAHAQRLRMTPGQLALAWLLAQGDDIVPIPGTKRIKYLEENVEAASQVPSAVELEPLAADLAAIEPAGDRYADMSLRL